MPPRGLLEASGPGRDGAGKCATFMPEQLALEQMLGDGAAVDRDERSFASRCFMDLSGNHLFAGTRLAADEHRRERRRNLFDEPSDDLHVGAVADQSCASAPRHSVT